MKTLGYIVTDRKLKNIDGFVEQVNDISLADSTKPILVVGWKNAKNCDGYTSILEKQLGNNIYWTFNKSESRSDFEKDLQMFYNIIYNNIYRLSSFVFWSVRRHFPAENKHLSGKDDHIYVRFCIS